MQPSRRLLLKLLPHDRPHRLENVLLLVQRRLAIRNDLLQCRLETEPEPVRPGLADVVALLLQRYGRVVDRGRVQVWFAERKPQLGQMRDLVRLPARRLEEGRRCNAPVDVAQRALGIGVQRSGVAVLAGNVELDRRPEPRLRRAAPARRSGSPARAAAPAPTSAAAR